MGHSTSPGSALVRWAVVLAVVASLGSLGIGLIVERMHERNHLEHAIEQNTTDLRALVEFTDRTAAGHSAPLAFEATLRLWTAISSDVHAPELWVIDAQGTVQFHSLDESKVGSALENRSLRATSPQDRQTLRDVVARGTSWSGIYVAKDGTARLAAIEPLSSELGALMGISLAPADFISSARDESAIWLGGIVVISLFIIPLSVTLLSGAYVRARRERDRSDAQLRETLQMVPGVVYRMERDAAGARRYTFVSDQVLALTDLTPEEVMKDRQSLLSRVHPDDRHRVDESIEAGARDGSKWACDFRILRPDGGISYVQGQSVATRSSIAKDSEVWHGILLDVTGQRQIEAELRTAKRSMDRAGDGIFWIRPSGRFVYVNDTAVQLLGHSRDELLKMFVWDIDPNLNPEMWPERYAQVKQAGSISFESIHQAADGRRFPVEINANFLDHQGQELICTFARDITARKDRERELRKARAAVEIDPDAAFWIRRDGRFVYVNACACESLGFSREEFMSMSVSDLDPKFPADRWDEVWNSLRTKGHAQIESSHERADGSKIPVDITASFLEFEGEQMICAYARDLSERNRAQAALRESEQHLRNLVEGTNVILWEVSMETLQFTYVSGHAERILGYPEHRWLEHDFWIEHMHPDDRDWVPKYCLEQSLKKRDHTFEYRMIAADGRTIWFRDLVSVVIENDELVATRGALVDITDQKLAEQLLRESEQRLRELATHLPGVVYSYDHTEGQPRRLVYLGPGLEDLLGPSVAQEVGGELDRLFERIHPDDRASLAEAVRVSKIDGSPVNSELRVRAEDGQWRWISSVARGLRIDELTNRWHVVLIDVTEHHLARQALVESENRYRAIVEQQTEFLCRFFHDGTLTFVNDAYCNYLITTRDELLGKNFLPTLPQDDQDIFHRAIESITFENPAVTLQHRVILPSGEVRWNEWVNRGLFDEQHNLIEYQSTGRDITELHIAQDELERTNQTLQFLLSELDHRVKNSMSGLLSLIDLSRRQSGSVDAYADSIRRRVATMSATHSLLSAGRWRAVDLETLLQTMTPAEAPGSVSAHGPRVEIPPHQVTAMGMVLNELLSNSLKHGALGHATGSVDLRWHIEPVGDQTKLELAWQERGGPTIESAPEPGLGTRLINGFASAELRGRATLAYPPEGASHHLELNLDRHEMETSPLAATLEVKQWRDADAHVARL